MSNLKTKKQLGKALYDASCVINGGCNTHKELNIIEGNDFFECVVTFPDGEIESVVGGRHKFRPEDQAPKKGRAVLDSFGRVAWSKGFFDENGYLMTVSSYYSIEGPSCCSKVDWCDLLNPAHHSEGWKKEWNVDLGGYNND